MNVLLVSLAHNGMEAHFTRNDCEGHGGENDIDW
jgi:hypothetical protein